MATGTIGAAWTDALIDSTESGTSDTANVQGHEVALGSVSTPLMGHMLGSDELTHAISSLLTITPTLYTLAHEHAIEALLTITPELYSGTAYSDKAELYAAAAEVAWAAPAGAPELYAAAVEVSYRWDAEQLYASVPRLAPTEGAAGATIVPLFELDMADGTTERHSEFGVTTSEGHYVEGVLSFGSLLRETPPEGGQFRIGEAGVVLNNATGYWSQKRSAGALRGLVGRYRLAIQAADGSTSVITVFTGVVDGFELTTRQASFTLVDKYYDVLRRRNTIPVNEFTFPLLPESTLRGRAVPIPMGEFSSAGAERRGLVPAYLVDPQFDLSPTLGPGTAQLDGAIDDVVTTLVLKNRTSVPEGGVLRIQVDSEIIELSETTDEGFTWTAARGLLGTTAASHSDSADVTTLVTYSYVAAQGELEEVTGVWVYGVEATEGVDFVVRVEEGGDVINGSPGQDFFWLGKVTFFDFVGDMRAGLGGVIPDGADTSATEVTYDCKGIKETDSPVTATNPVSQLGMFLRIYGAFTDDDIDLGSETRAKLTADNLGLSSAFMYLSDDELVSDVINRFAVSFGMTITATVEGKLRFVFPARSIQFPGFVEHLTEELHVLADSLRMRGVEEVISRSRAYYRRDWVVDKWASAYDFSNPDSNSATYGGPKDLELWYVGSDAAASAAVNQVFYFHAEGRLVVDLEADPHLHKVIDIGDAIALSHRAGPSADGEGWAASFFRIIGLGLQLGDGARLTLTLVDIGPYEATASSANYRLTQADPETPDPAGDEYSPPMWTTGRN